MSTTNQSLQVKLTLDEGLSTVWDTLKKEYIGLDKSGIVRLALSRLAKSVEKRHGAEFDLEAFFADLDKGKSGMTEKDFAEWWNENKHDIV